MANVILEKLGEHSGSIKGIAIVLWHVRVENTIDEYYIPADKVHNKLGGGYWADTKNLIPMEKARVVKAFETPIEQLYEPGIYLDITCGQCGIVNTMNQSTLQKHQGSHFCESCKSTIGVVNGIHIKLKNGSSAGRLYQR